MTAQSILLNSETKDYVPIDGNIANGPLVETIMYTRLSTRRLGWMYSEDPTFGSNLNRYTSERIAVTPILIEQDFFISLQPMVSLRQIINLQVVFTGYAANGAWLYKISAQDITGAPIQFTYPYYKVAL